MDEEKLEVEETLAAPYEGYMVIKPSLYEKMQKEHKALEIIKALFQGRCKLFERTENVETCNEAGCHAEKVATTSYILKFNNYDLHYEFYLHKEEYELLKEVGL